jgi:3-deoxy-7-phosphoheptulonate synthase
MIVAMQDAASEDQIQRVIDQLVHFGFEVHRSTGARQTVLGGVGVPHDFDTREVEMLPGVQEVHRITSPYKLAGRNFRPEGTIVKFANGIEIGGKKIVVMAGPCSVESRDQLFTVAEQISKAGARLRIRFKASASTVSNSSAKLEIISTCSSSAKSWRFPRST